MDISYTATFSEQSETENISLTYEVIDGDNIRVNQIDGFPSTIFTRVENKYSAVVELEDGASDTFWPDYQNWFITITDNSDTDSDGIPDLSDACPSDPNKTSPGICGCGILDNDSDNDGILNCVEDINHNSIVDGGETDPNSTDSDGDEIQDGTELGYTVLDISTDTNIDIFIADLDPLTQTDPLLTDTDGDGKIDGVEDANHNGMIDGEESDPLDPDDPCAFTDYFIVNPICSVFESSDTDRIVFFDSSQASCYEMVSCVNESRTCTDEWNFGGSGGIVGGNGQDIIVYRYDEAGDYSASLTMTEQESRTTVTDTLKVTAEIVQTPLPALDFVSCVANATVSLTIEDLDPTDSEITSVIVFWGDRYRTVDTVSLPVTINHTYTRTGSDYHLRVKAILSDNGVFNYTFMADEDLTVSIPINGDGIDDGCVSCDSNNLEICTTNSDCVSAGGYWWSDNTCLGIPESETVTSAGQIWMDRNLGASQVATSSTDSAAYGDLYQWGRGPDGHQLRTSATTSTTSPDDVPGHDDFILTFTYPYDWRYPQNDVLWQGVSGTNNPCPAGFRLPTETEFETERVSWGSDDSAGAFASPLKLVVAGNRYYSNGWLLSGDNYGYYWSSTGNGNLARYLYFGSGHANMFNDTRASGFSVRCIMD